VSCILQNFSTLNEDRYRKYIFVAVNQINKCMSKKNSGKMLMLICFLLCVLPLLVHAKFKHSRLSTLSAGEINSLVYIHTFEIPSVCFSTKLLHRQIIVNNEIKASIPSECDLATLRIKKINHRIDAQLQPSSTTTMCLLSCVLSRQTQKEDGEEARWV
jgi:hypothetical protein